MKKCKTCNTKKDILEFGIHKKFKDGHQIHCKACRQKNRKEYIINNKKVFDADTKKCNKCKTDKKITEFWKCSQSINGYSTQCKTCKREPRRLPEQILKTKISHSKYIIKNKEKLSLKNKNYREKNKERLNINLIEYRINNKEKINESVKKHYIKNREAILAKKKIHHKKNKEKERVYTNERNKIRRKTEPLFKLKCYLKSRIWFFFKENNWNKSKKSEIILGTSFEIVKKHIEKQFTKGMNWANQGQWHIDHIIPLSFAKTQEELIQLFHYTNLQPLWALDNLEKGNKIMPTQMKLTI